MSWFTVDPSIKKYPLNLFLGRTVEEKCLNRDLMRWGFLLLLLF